jgi:hypothetical protein
MRPEMKFTLIAARLRKVAADMGALAVEDHDYVL